jgi:hypothetical protein
MLTTSETPKRMRLRNVIQNVACFIERYASRVRPNGLAAHLHQTALTGNAEAEPHDARMLPRIDWNELFDVSFSALLGSRQ